MDPEEVEVDKVTSGKAKSPGRVAWGKKLAALAKAHKEEKAATRRQNHEEEQVEPVPKQKEASSRTSLCAWLAVGSLVIGMAALYYQRRAALRAPSHVQRCEVDQPQQTAQPPKKPVAKIIAMQ